MGGAQPLAVTLNQGVALVVDVDITRLERRKSKRYLDVVETELTKAIERAKAADKSRRAKAPRVQPGTNQPGLPRETLPMQLRVAKATPGAFARTLSSKVVRTRPFSTTRKRLPDCCTPTLVPSSA